ncbi:hypothetical protein ACJJTC_010164 [Scirpophaga incertulas]
MDCVIFIVFFSLISINKCAFINVGSNRHIRNEDRIFNRYINSITQLADRFPGHVLEIELNLETPDPPRISNQRTYVHFVKPFTEQNILRMDSSTTTTATSTTQSTVPSSTSSSPSFVTIQLDPDNIPVYLNNLKKVIEEYEKKSANLLGVNVQAQAPKPSADKMWFEIKIPK